MKYFLAAALGVTGAMIAPLDVSAHFNMVEPAGWLVQNPLGDPQKLAPCGGTSADPGTPTNIVEQHRGGDLLHIKLHETVFHPGHYRVALAVQSRAELPPDPDVTTRDTPKGPFSVSAVITTPRMPVLADGLFVHTERQAEGAFFESDVKLPNINCDKCTLQVVEFMAEHPFNHDGGYTYHHCADMKITANPALPRDKTWPGQ